MSETPTEGLGEGAAEPLVVPPKHLGDEWLSSEQAAAALGLGLRALYRLIDQGQIPAYQMGRVIRLRRQDVEKVAGRRAVQEARQRRRQTVGTP